MVTRFGAYEILYELRTGGMGAVLLGRRRGPGAFEQLVALKTIRPEYAQAAAVRAMFLDEAAILARLSHPGIATVHDFGEQAGTLYMVMEYVAGIAFRDAMAYAMPPGIAARAIAEACRGVHAAHELRDLAGGLLGVVHRDISPDNLMFGFDGHIKVIDFGIALIKNRQAPVTELGTLKGKPPYMSPEQVKNEAIDRRSDVFSLAVVLWEMLTGQALFRGDSIYAVALAVEQQDILPPSRVRGEPLPPGLDAVVMSALARDRSQRTPSAAELAEQLERVSQTADDETLEAWAERALAEPRSQHRAWLAGIITGRDAPRPLGRPTGAVTALSAPSPAAPAQPIAPAPGPAPDPVLAPGPGGSRPDPRGPTHLDARPERVQRPPGPELAAEQPPEPARAGGAERTTARVPDLIPEAALARDVRPGRRRRTAIVLGIATLAIVGGVVLVARDPAATPPPPDAGRVTPSHITPTAETPAPAGNELARQTIDAGPAMSAAPVAAVDAGPEPSSDRPPAPAAPSLAGHRRPVRPPREPGHAAAPAPSQPRDALPVASAASEPHGVATLTAKHKGDRYLSVVLDGHVLGPTPMFGHRIPAGTHVIELVDARTSDVVVKRTLKVDDGESATVVEP